MLGVVFGAGEVAVRHSLVPPYGYDLDALAYEIGAELPQRLKFTAAVYYKADVLFWAIPRDPEIVIHNSSHNLILILRSSRDLF